MWYIGQKIVCVDTAGTTYPLVKDKIYTVTEINVCKHSLVQLSLKGVVSWTGNTRLVCGCGIVDGSWLKASRFRPLLTDSIEFAEELLNEITIEINEENLVTK